MSDRLLKNRPTEPGIYWAKWDDVKWWCLLVKVEGEAPFLRCRIVWNRHDEKRTGRVAIEDITEFGEQVPEPVE